MIFGSIFAGGLLTTGAFCQPPRTTIQDVLYKADGTRFNGSLTISWSSFEAIDRSAIAPQTTTVTVVDGNLRVQLVPTITAIPSASYRVRYASDGKVQFTENWAVPSSTQPLRVRDVRVANAATATADPGTSTSVNESEGIGLISDLGARPLKTPATPSDQRRGSMRPAPSKPSPARPTIACASLGARGPASVPRLPSWITTLPPAWRMART
jgi:hypothetical protein